MNEIHTVPAHKGLQVQLRRQTYDRYTEYHVITQEYEKFYDTQVKVPSIHQESYREMLD